MKKKIVLVSIGTALLLVLMLIIAKPSELVKGIKTIGVEFILLIICLYLINLCVKALRWKVMMTALGKDISYKKMLPIFIVGMAINNVTPGRIAGDPIRALIIKNEENISLEKCIAAVFSEKSLDLIFLILLSFVGFAILIPALPNRFRLQILFSLVVISAMMFTGLFVLFNPAIIKKMTNPFLKSGFKPFQIKIFRSLIKKGRSFAFNLNDSLRMIMKNRKMGFISTLLTLMIWSNEAFRLFLIMRGLGENVSFGGVFLVSNIATLVGMAVPWGAGNAATITAIFSGMGTSVEQAATAGFLAIITSIWLSVPLGALIMVFTGTKAVKDALKNRKKTGTETNMKKDK